MADIRLNFRRQVRTATAVQVNNKVHRLVLVMAAAVVDLISSKDLHLDLGMAEAINSTDLHLVLVMKVAMLAPTMDLDIHFQAVAVAANRAAKAQTVAIAPTRIRIHLVPAKVVKAVITVSINKVRVLVPAQDHHHSWAIIRNQVINQVINLEAQAAYSLIFIVIIHYNNSFVVKVTRKTFCNTSAIIPRISGKPSGGHTGQQHPENEGHYTYSEGPNGPASSSYEHEGGAQGGNGGFGGSGGGSGGGGSGGHSGQGGNNRPQQSPGNSGHSSSFTHSSSQGSSTHTHSHEGTRKCINFNFFNIKHLNCGTRYFSSFNRAVLNYFSDYYKIHSIQYIYRFFLRRQTIETFKRQQWSVC